MSNNLKKNILKKLTLIIIQFNFLLFSLVVFASDIGGDVIFDDNLFFVDSEKAKIVLQDIIQKIGNSDSKIKIEILGDKSSKPQIIDKKEDITGYFFIGEMGKDIKFQMNIKFSSPSKDVKEKSSFSSPDITNSEIFKKGQIPINGQYIYDKYGKILFLSGDIKNNGEFELSEYYYNENNEKITTGKLKGKFKSNFTEGSGKWISADGKKFFDFRINKKATYKRIDKEYKTNNIFDEVYLDILYNNLCKNDENCFKERLKEYKYGLHSVGVNYIIFEEENFRKINKKIEHEIEKTFHEFEDSIDASQITISASLYVDYKIAYYFKNLVSILIDTSADFGGAHPNYFTNSILLKHNPKSSTFEFIELFDLIDKSYACRGKLLNLIFKALKTGNRADDLFPDNEVKNELNNSIFRDPPHLTYTIDKIGFTFIFSPYLVGPFAAGSFEAQIPYEELIKANCLPKNSPLMEIIVKKIKNRTKY